MSDSDQADTKLQSNALNYGKNNTVKIPEQKILTCINRGVG